MHLATTSLSYTSFRSSSPGWLPKNIRHKQAQLDLGTVLIRHYGCINNTSDYTLNDLYKGFGLIEVTIIDFCNVRVK